MVCGAAGTCTVLARSPEVSPARISPLPGTTESIASVEFSVEAFVAGRVTLGVPSLRFESDRRFSAVVLLAGGAAGSTKNALFGVLKAAFPKDNRAWTRGALLPNVESPLRSSQAPP